MEDWGGFTRRGHSDLLPMPGRGRRLTGATSLGDIAQASRSCSSEKTLLFPRHRPISGQAQVAPDYSG
jgi:hypothetical protein